MHNTHSYIVSRQVHSLITSLYSLLGVMIIATRTVMVCRMKGCTTRVSGYNIMLCLLSGDLL